MIETDEYECKYVEGLETLLREVMYAGGNPTKNIPPMDTEKWGELFTKCKTHLGDEMGADDAAE